LKKFERQSDAPSDSFGVFGRRCGDLPALENPNAVKEIKSFGKN
jgi:hypothetical protein